MWRVTLNLNQDIRFKGDVNWSIPNLQAMIKKYQDPKQADKLLKLQSDLQEINQIMTKNLDDVKWSVELYSMWLDFKKRRDLDHANVKK